MVGDGGGGSAVLLRPKWSGLECEGVGRVLGEVAAGVEVLRGGLPMRAVSGAEGKGDFGEALAELWPEMVGGNLGRQGGGAGGVGREKGRSR